MDALPANRSWQPSCSHGTYQHETITSRSRQLLMMGTWLPETCWSTIRREIKNTKVTSSWFFLSTLNYDARSTTHQILMISKRYGYSKVCRNLSASSLIIAFGIQFTYSWWSNRQTFVQVTMLVHLRSVPPFTNLKHNNDYPQKFLLVFLIFRSNVRGTKRNSS